MISPKTFLKHSYKNIIIASVIAAALSYLFDSYIVFLFFLVGIARDYYRYNSRIDEIKRLEKKGLTEEDVSNIHFVKKWEETRKKGIWKYCIVDGGIILGAGLSIVISLIISTMHRDTFEFLAADPNNMLSFIGYNFLAGAVIGLVSCRILWTIRERKFLRLTDPLNDKYIVELFQDY